MPELDYNLPEELSKRYELLSLLGEGGAGQVYKAKDSILDSIVAIKVLNVASDERKVLRLQREAIVLGKLNHKNITSIIDFNFVENVPYIIAEYIEGKTLSCLIEGGELGFDDELDIAIQICKALSYAHEQGVVHRDIKPENIMVKRDDNNDLLVKVLDFGMAKIDQDDQFLTTSGSFIGTPLYASPEQFKGSKTDYKTDLYSLGCLLFYLFSKSVPYEADNTIKAAEMHANYPIPDLEHNELNNETIDAIKCCLEKAPSKRPENTDSILDLLKSNYSSVKEVQEEEEVVNYDTSSPISKRVIFISIFFLLGTLISIPMLIGIYSKIETKKVIKKPNQLKPDEEYSLLPSGLDIDNLQKVKEENVVIDKFGPGGRRTITLGKSAGDLTLRQLEGENIEVLTLWHNPLIKGSGLRYIENCPLKQLILSKTKLTEKYLVHVAKITTLRQLHMSECPTLSNETIQFIQPLKDLEELEITSRQLTNDGLKNISNFKKLHSLTYGGSKFIDDKCLSYLQKLPKLKTLGLPNTNVSSNIVSKILNFKDLRNLNLSENHILNDRTITDLVKLDPYNLDLSNTNISDANLSQLVEAKNITELNLSDTLVTFEGIRELRKLPNLKSLKIKRMKVDTKFAAELSRLKLEVVDLYESIIKDNDLRLLIRMKNLQILQLNKCFELSSKGIEQFKSEFLEQHKRQLNVTY